MENSSEHFRCMWLDQCQTSILNYCLLRNISLKYFWMDWNNLNIHKHWIIEAFYSVSQGYCCHRYEGFLSTKYILWFTVNSLIANQNPHHVLWFLNNDIIVPYHIFKVKDLFITYCANHPWAAAILSRERWALLFILIHSLLV